MDVKDLLDEEDLKALENVDTTPLKTIEEVEKEKKEISGDYPKCETCRNWLSRSAGKGICNNPEHSRNMWIEMLPIPPLTTTKDFGCLEHTDLVKE